MTRFAPRHWRNGRLAAAVAVGYLLFVAATFALVAYDLAFVEHDDASLSGVLPWFATQPLSMPGIWLVPDSTGLLAGALFFGIPAVAGLLQATGLWLLIRGRPVEESMEPVHRRRRPGGPVAG